MKKMKYVLLSTLLLSCGIFTSCNNTTKVDVMVVGVHDYTNPDFHEISILIDALTNKSVHTIDNLNFYTGKIDNKKVVIAESPVGTSEAAMTTTIGIKQYHPKYVLGEGTSGGHHEGAEVNDIILGKEILDVASFKGPADHPMQWSNEEKYYKGLMHPPLYGNKDLLNIAKEVENEHVKAVKPDGIIASSDCWNTGIDFVNELHQRLNEDCEEMESYAVANVCNHYKIPMLPIRIISNNLILGTGEDEPGEFDPEAGHNCQYFVLDVIKAI